MLGISYSFSQARRYPRHLDQLATLVDEPDLSFLTQECVAGQFGTTVDNVPSIDSSVSVFHSAVATFFSPGDPCGTHGMRREHIYSTPSWRGRGQRHDCGFVVDDDEIPGMRGMNIARVQLLFSFEFDGIYFPCALVEWFDRVRHDDATGMWIVRPALSHGMREKSVIHLDSFLRAAHLIPVFGEERVPRELDRTMSLDTFREYYVNKYIDHHAFEIAY
jgi:hypothetical protein